MLQWKTISKNRIFNWQYLKIDLQSGIRQWMMNCCISRTNNNFWFGKLKLVSTNKFRLWIKYQKFLNHYTNKQACKNLGNSIIYNLQFNFPSHPATLMYLIGGVWLHQAIYWLSWLIIYFIIKAKLSIIIVCKSIYNS